MASRSPIASLCRAGLAVALACAVVLANASAQAGDFVFVRNAKNKTASISRRDVRQLFTGQTKQWGGAVVQAVIGEEDSAEFRYLCGIFGLEPRELISKIKQEVFRGEMRRPIVAKTPADCIVA